jgi:hypothetical protein
MLWRIFSAIREFLPEGLENGMNFASRWILREGSRNGRRIFNQNG